MPETNTSNIGFEKQIWDAACVLRGNMDASEYKSVVLGLIFLKYISDRFESKYNELVAEGDGFEEDKDEYTAENIFFVPESARWGVIAAAAHTPEIGTVIDDAMRAIERENKRLKDILPKNFARRSWTSGVWATWLTCLPTSKWSSTATARTFWAALMSTACPGSPSRRANWPVSSTPRPAWCALW